MVKIIYQVAIQVFAFLFRLVAPFNPKLKLGAEGRKGLLDRLRSTFPAQSAGRPVAWFHAASLGEFEQGRPVIEAYREAFPDHFILLTFFSPSGYEIRKNYTGADLICYLPIDTPSNAREFVQITRPQVAFFIKYEFWFNYLRELRKNGSYILSFSTIFRPNQIFFKPYGGFFRKMLGYFDHLFVQNQASVTLLSGIGITHASIAGDTRFDRVRAIASNARELPEIGLFKSGNQCLIAGSVWDADMQVLIPALNALTGKLKAIIAPHEIKADEIAGWRAKLSGRSILYSEVAAGQNPEGFDYLIINNIGMLSSLYRYGNMAYIGGSFGVGLHNILEAATFGLPVVFGNKSYHRFQEAVDLIEKGGAFAMADSNALLQMLERWVNNPGSASAAGGISREYVHSGTGATGRIMQKVREAMR
ncbi:3-deoxy-D-manno-octulosonic acid transferase [Dyadobacter fermentans]|uniref:3-deoxy-D-manno-octulosonic acid transferase n=1 Tax=Dyadobacter fermentans (strain ATCC 700827 / DSM 18053 / CIP 107007 / KCTC 52180 / NS114) TaxID=471854 RepID=C6W7D5_DYAFD|nr:Three-deoxy-D-manno-octulosonic-acid transferase domain protein [Dyadobacter fermentans DSM 18053]